MRLPSLSRRDILVAVSIFFGVAVAALPACNTTEGVGEDIEATGEAIEDAASD
ncbi:MAG: entericidin A/B family lipoprotein [Phycisphaerales bacterium]